MNVDTRVQKVSVYGEPGVYAGWPANHGAWQWGDEFLVGFIRGRYGRSAMHNVVGPLQKVQARSLDGGETWAVEVPNVDFEAASTRDAPAVRLDDSIIRVCGGYDHGGEECDPGGGFYLSQNRGKSWDGAFKFTGIEDAFDAPAHCTARTRVHGGLIFLSRAHRGHWGSDSIFCATHDGARFKLHGVVCDDDARAVMPAVAQIGNEIIAVARRRGSRRPGGWIDAFASADGGRTWSPRSHVADTGNNNGNPPALIESGGRLLCAYANRQLRGVYVSYSSDSGVAWHHGLTLREGSNSDIGYPQLFKRNDGRLVCVYYWSDGSRDPQRIEASIFKACDVG